MRLYSIDLISSVVLQKPNIHRSSNDFNEFGNVHGIPNRRDIWWMETEVERCVKSDRTQIYQFTHFTRMKKQ